MATRILLVDDHKILRDGIRALLHAELDFDVIGEATDGEVAVEMADKLRPDVVVMDINIPRLNGLAATQLIKRKHPTVKVIILSGTVNQRACETATAAGAAGFVSKGDAFEQLADTIRKATSPAKLVE